MEKKNRYIIGWSMGLQIASTALMIPAILFTMGLMFSPSFREAIGNGLNYLLGLNQQGGFGDDWDNFFKIIWLFYMTVIFVIFLLVLSLISNIISLAAVFIWSRYIGNLIVYTLSWFLEIVAFIGMACWIFVPDGSYKPLFATMLILIMIAKVNELLSMISLFSQAGKELGKSTPINLSEPSSLG